MYSLKKFYSASEKRTPSAAAISMIGTCYIAEGEDVRLAVDVHRLGAEVDARRRNVVILQTQKTFSGLGAVVVASAPGL
jgi:hypothetical protein